MMLNITEFQLAKFKDDSFQGFIRRACVHLRNIYGEDLNDMSDAELTSFSESGIERARSFNLKSEKEVIEFLSFSVVFGAEFPDTSDTPWAKNILLSPYPGKQRIDALHHQAQFDLQGQN